MRHISEALRISSIADNAAFYRGHRVRSRRFRASEIELQDSNTGVAKPKRLRYTRLLYTYLDGKGMIARFRNSVFECSRRLNEALDSMHFASLATI